MSFGSVGQALLTIAGTFVGAAFGNPLLGLSLGNSIGGAIFNKPPTMYGPRLGDRPTTDSEVGAFVPICFGTVVVSGTVIYANPNITEEAIAKRASKGAPKQITYSYYQTIAIGLCEGPITDVRRVWENGKCVFDRRPQQDGESDAAYSARVAQSEQYSATFTLYTGTDTQSADPQLESEIGAGEVPGFRGLAYIVFPDRDLQEEQGLRHPDFKVEVIAEGSIVEQTFTDYANELLLDWPGDAVARVDPRSTLQHYEYRGYDASLLPGDPYSRADAGSLPGALAQTKHSGGSPWALVYYQFGWGLMGGNGANAGVWPYVGPGSAQLSAYTLDVKYTRELYFYYNELAASGISNAQWDVGGPTFEAFLLSVGAGKYWTGNNDTLSMSQHGVLYMTGFDPPLSSIECKPDIGIQVRRVPMPPLDISIGKLPAPIEGYYIDDDGSYVKQTPWTLVSGTFRVLSETLYESSGVSYTSLPLNPVLPSTDPNYSNKPYWDALYADAVTAGDAPAGKSYNTPGGYGSVQNWAYQRTRSVVTTIAYEVSIGSIVDAIASRVSDATIDVTDLDDDMIPGFKIESRMAARAAIETLRPVAHFDIIASGATLKFPQRGKAIVKTFTAEELSARAHGESRPPAIAMRDRDASELPRRLTVRYLSLARDHEVASQPSPARIESRTVSEPTLDIAAVLDDDRAAQIAEEAWSEEWNGRRGYTAATSLRDLALEPADAVGLPVDGRTVRALLRTVEFARPGVMLLEAVRELVAQYSSSATGSTPQSVPINDLPIIGAPQLSLLDLPYLGPADPRGPSDNASALVLVRSVGGNTFRGATIERTLDGGATYETMLSAATRPAYGTLVSALGSGPTTVFDGASELTVELQDGTLESRDIDAVLAGANLCAIGAHGRWEVLQFASAEAISGTQWKLTDLLRGRRGTEWAVGTSESGDLFVLLSPVGACPVLELDTTQVGTALALRTTLAGTLTSAGEVSSFTPGGVILKPFAPVALGVSGSLDEGGWVLSWSRRDRVAIELPQSGAFALSEAVESYEVDLLDSAGTVLATIETSTPSAEIAELASVGGASSGISQESTLAVPLRFVEWNAGLSQYIGVYSLGYGNASLRRFDSSLTYLNGAGFGNSGTAYAAYGMTTLGAHAYVAVVNQGAGSAGLVLKYSTSDFAYVGEYNGTAAGDCQDVVSDGAALWATEPVTGAIRKLDPSTMTVSATVAFTCNKITFDGTSVWAAYGGTLKKIDPSTATVLSTYAYADTSVVVRMLSTATRVAIRTATGVTIVNAATGATVAAHTMSVAGSGTYGVELAYDGASFIVYDATANALTFIDPSTGAIERAQVFAPALESYRSFSIYMPTVGGALAGVANGRYFLTRSPSGSSTAPAAQTYVFESLAAGSGAGAPYSARVYQVSQSVGRGYPAEIELP